MWSNCFPRRDFCNLTDCWSSLVWSSGMVEYGICSVYEWLVCCKLWVNAKCEVITSSMWSNDVLMTCGWVCRWYHYVVFAYIFLLDILWFWLRGLRIRCKVIFTSTLIEFWIESTFMELFVVIASVECDRRCDQFIFLTYLWLCHLWFVWSCAVNVLRAPFMMVMACTLVCLIAILWHVKSDSSFGVN